MTSIAPAPEIFMPVSQFRDFPIGLFEVGQLGPCLFSYCCTPCALARARSKMDGSSCFFNLMVNGPALRWFIRSAYNIPGSEVSDIATVCFLYPCAVNQLVQTVKRLGPPAPNGGKNFNGHNWKTRLDADMFLCFKYCLYSTFLPSCAVATALQNAFDMPLWFGYLCMNPCAATNFIRYQYRIDGDEMFEDCLGAFLFPFNINILMKLLTETRKLSVEEGWPKRYLATPNIASVPIAVQPSIPNQMPSTAMAYVEAQPAVGSSEVSMSVGAFIQEDYPPSPNYSHQAYAMKS